MSNARNISALNTVEVGATTDQTKADLNAIGVSGGRKNLIINGGFDVWQRGTSFTSITTSDYRADRFRSAISNLGTWTITKDSNGPSGFENSIKYACTVVDTAPDPANYIFMHHKIEGQDLYQIKKGTAQSESVSLQFRIKSNKTGDVQVNLRDRDNTRHIGSVVTISASDTWETKVITFVGDATGALVADESSGLEVEWWLNAGTNFTSGAVPTSWESAANTDRGAGTTLNLGGSTSDYINITGVQLELGSVATDFEHATSYGETLALCQRYYWKTDTIVHFNMSRYYSSAGNAFAYFSFPNRMRADPSFSHGGTWSAGVGYGGVPILQTAYLDGVTLKSTRALNANETIYMSNGHFIFDSEL